MMYVCMYVCVLDMSLVNLSHILLVCEHLLSFFGSCFAVGQLFPERVRLRSVLRERVPRRRELDLRIVQFRPELGHGRLLPSGMNLFTGN